MPSAIYNRIVRIVFLICGITSILRYLDEPFSILNCNSRSIVVPVKRLDRKVVCSRAVDGVIPSRSDIDCIDIVLFNSEAACTRRTDSIIIGGIEEVSPSIY